MKTNKDNQYIDYRDCANIPVDIKKVYKIGVLRDVYKCDSILDWYSDKAGDLKVLTYEPDKISFDRSEKASSMPIKQTEAGQNSIEWGKEIELEFNYSSKFLQRIADMFANEHYSKDEGRGLIALSNGGIWFQEEEVYDEGKATEYRRTTTYGNMKISEMTVPLSGIILPDTTYALSLLVENYPIIEEEGMKPAGYGLPKNIVAPVFSLATTTTAEATITYTDTGNVIYKDKDDKTKSFYELYSVTGTGESKEYTFIESGIVLDDSDTDITITFKTALGTGEYYIKFGIFISDNLRSYIKEWYVPASTKKGKKVEETQEQ